jgi:hypothetical protein
MSQTDPEESARLLQAGTAIFLGHYAGPAVPLQPSDKPAGASIPFQGDQRSSS